MILGKRTRIMSRPMMILGVAVLVLALPAEATAQAGDPRTDPTAAQYESPIGGGGENGEPEPEPAAEQPVTTSTGGGPADGGGESAAPASASTLPFTGFDAGVMALVALMLGATGFALRRMSAVR